MSTRIFLWHWAWKRFWHETIWHWLARKMPARLRYWAFIVAGARAIRGDEVVPTVTFAELLRRIPS